MEDEYKLSSLREMSWCLGIDHLELSENGVLPAYFYPCVEDVRDEDLKRFILTLSEFVKNYR